jgi:hypothetical protein
MMAPPSTSRAKISAPRRIVKPPRVQRFDEIAVPEQGAALQPC